MIPQRDRIGGDWSPYARFNLIRNPFGELTPAQRAETAIADLTPWRDMLARDHRVIQVIGRPGRGKSTRLLKFHFAHPDSTYHYLPLDRKLPPIADASVIIIDEAQRMSRSMRQQVFSTGRPLLISSHWPLGVFLRRYRYQVHTIYIGRNNDAGLVAEAMNARIDAARWGPGPVPRITLAQATRLRHHHGSNVRAIESDLYDQFQQHCWRLQRDCPSPERRGGPRDSPDTFLTASPRTGESRCQNVS